MALLESGEMYLETLHLLLKEKENVRAADLGRAMGYSRPSVSRAMSILKKEGYVVVGKHGFITFTEKGKKKAEEVYEKHVVLTDFFESIGVSPEVAEEDACRIEHVISNETFEKVRDQLQK